MVLLPQTKYHNALRFLSEVPKPEALVMVAMSWMKDGEKVLIGGEHLGSKAGEVLDGT